jgi:hypothetical protein
MYAPILKDLAHTSPDVELQKIEIEEDIKRSAYVGAVQFYRF